MMRLLHLVGSVSPAAGGPSEAIRLLVKYAPEDIVSEVASLDDPAMPFLADLAFPVHALGVALPSAAARHNRTAPPPSDDGSVPTCRHAGSAWYSPHLLPWLRANRHRFDAIIVHGLWEYTGLAARRSGLPYITFPHGMLDPWFRRASPFKHLKKQLYWLLVEFWNLRRARRVLFTTDLEATLAENAFWPSTWVPAITPLGADAPPPPSVDLMRLFHHRCPAVANRRFLLYLGRIDPKKGVDMLLEAFCAANRDDDAAPMAASDPDLHLVIAGPDPTGWGDGLRYTCSDSGFSHRVHWTGMLEGPVKWGAFMACEAFILPSHQENFGIAVTEALASGRPVLLSDQVNIAAEVAAAHCGLVEPDTLAGTRRLLARWIALSETERSTMGLLACACFARHYDMRRNAAAVLRTLTLPTGPSQTPTGFSDAPRAEVAP